MSDVLVAGIPSLLVAIVGIAGVLVTQARADARQERIATAARAEQRTADLADRRREATSDFLVAVWDLARLDRAVVVIDEDTTTLSREEMADLDKAYSRATVILESGQRKALVALQDDLLKWFVDPTPENWAAMGEAEDRLVELVNAEPTT